MSTEQKNKLYNLYAEGRVSRYDYLRRLMPDSSIFDMMDQYFHECCMNNGHEDWSDKDWWKNSGIDKDIAFSAVWNGTEAVPPTISTLNDCFQVLNRQFAFYMNKTISKDTMIPVPFASGTYKIIRNDLKYDPKTKNVFAIKPFTVDMLQICNDKGEPISIKDFIVPLRQSKNFANEMFIVTHESFEPILKIKVPEEETSPSISFSILGVAL